MLKKYFIMAIAAGFALVACSEKFDEPGILPAGSDNVHTLSVGIEAGTYTPAEGETKASMEAVVRVNWTVGDEVSVVNATTKKILGGCLKAKESGVSVTFEGTVTGEINNGNKLYYIYPKLDNTGETAFADAGYDVSLAGQTYDGDNPGKVSFFGYAEDVATTATISKKIQFKLVTSYAHLNMANLPAKGFNLSSIDISNVNEGFTWKLSDNTLAAAPYAGSNGISVTCTNYNITQAGNAVVRFAIPASAASSDARVVTVNKAYSNDAYTKAEREAATYYNQLYTSWTNDNVNVKSTSGTKTEVEINNLGSTEVAEGILPVSSDQSSSAFTDNKPTEIKLGGLGTITFNDKASTAIKTNATGSTDTGPKEVFFKVEDVTQTKPVQDANLVYEITMKTLDENGTEVFSKTNAGQGSEATVVIELGQSVEDVDSVSLVDENGSQILDENDWNFDDQTGTLTFTVVHFSKYAIEYTEKQSGEQNYVAQIGGRKYTTLANAIAAAQNGNTIQMIADFTAPAKIEIGADKNIILDLNGHTISYSTSEFEAFITNKGSLRITDSSIGKNGKITATHSKLDYISGCYTIDNFGGDQSANKISKLVIDAGTIENASTGDGLAWPVNNGSWNSNAELIINGGTIHSANYVPVREYLQYGGKKTIVINGGKFISDNSRAIAVQVNDATIQDTGSSVTINGGEFTCKGSGILYVDMHAANANLSGFTMTINGGKFKNSNTEAPVLAYDYESHDHDSAVLLSKILKGGTYSKEPAAELLADGYELVDNQDAGYPYKVQQKSYATTLLRGSEVFGKYETIADAVAAFNFDENITAGDYTLNIKPGTYNEDMILFIQDKTEGKYRTLTVQSADSKEKVIVKSSNDHRVVFGIAAESDYSGGPISFKNIDIDISENTNSQAYPVYFAGSQSGTPDLIFPEPSTNYNRRYGHNVSFENCNIIGNGTSQAFVGSTGTGAIKVENCSITNCAYGFAGYYVFNPGHTTFGLHIKEVTFNGGTFINDESAGNTEIVVENCVLNSNSDYVIRTSGGSLILNNCDYQLVIKDTKIIVDGAYMGDSRGVIYFRNKETHASIDNCTITKKNLTQKDETCILYDIYNKNTTVTINGKNLPSGSLVNLNWLTETE